MKTRTIILYCVLTLPLVAQSKDPSARNLGHGTSNPATCNAGDIFFRTDLTAGQNVMECQSTNTWTQQLNSGGGLNQLTGDVTAGPGTGSQVATLATVNGGPGTCGDSTHVCQVTTNGKGLTTAQSAVTISGGGGGPNLLTLSVSTGNLAIGSCSSGTPCLISIGGSVYTFTSNSSAVPASGSDTWYVWVTSAGVIDVGYNSVAPTCTACTAVPGTTTFPAGGAANGNYLLGTATVTSGAVASVALMNAVQNAAPAFTAGANITLTPTANSVQISASGGGGTNVVVERDLAAGACTGTAGTASTEWWLPATNAVTISCSQWATLNFQNSGVGNNIAQAHMLIPAGWSGGAVNLTAVMTSGTTSTAYTYSVATQCMTATTAGPPTSGFNTAQTLSFTSSSTAFGTVYATLSGITTTGCSAGQLLVVQFTRSDAVSGLAYLAEADFQFTKPLP